MEDSPFTDTFVTKFNHSDRSIYVKFDWKPNESDLFHAKIFDGDSVWSGVISNESVQRIYCKRMELTYEDYCDTFRSILKNSSNEYVFIFPKVDSGVNTSEFVWKRKTELGFLVCGTITVNLVDGLECKDTIIDFLLLENNEFKRKIEYYQKNTEEMNCDLSRYKNELEKFSNIKNNMEITLYGKFVQVLNEKKKRIQKLEESLRKLSDHQHTDEMT